MSGEHNCTVIVQFRYLLCCSGIYVAFLVGFWGFWWRNFYIVSSSFVYRVFCGCMKRAVLLQEDAVSAFGVGFYCRVLQEGQCDDTFDIARNGRNICKFFSKYGTVCIQKLRPHQLPHGIVCTDRRITNTYCSSARSQFIYTETQCAFFLPSVESLLTICQNITDLNSNVLHFAMSEVILPLPRNTLCAPLFM